MSETTKGFDFSDVSVQDILDDSAQDPTPGTDDSQDDQDTSSDADTDSDDQNQDDSSQDGDDNDDQNQDDADDSSDADDSDNSDDSDDVDQDDQDGDDAEPTVIEELQNLLGVELEDGEEFSDDIDGIAKFTTKAGEKMGQQYLANLFEAFPDVEKYLNYRSQGGDASKYFELEQKAMTYDNLSEDTLKDNVQMQKTVVSEMFSKMGYSDEDIKETIKDLEDSELLLKQAVKSGTRLKAIAQEESQAEITRQAELAEQNKQKVADTWKEISTKISDGNLKGFKVPETDKKSFYNWMSKPVDSKGTTQRQIDMEKMDVESTLALEYLYYQNFDLGKMAKNFKTTAKNNSLRNRLGKKNTGASPARRLSGGSKGGNSRTVKLPELNDVF